MGGSYAASSIHKYNKMWRRFASFASRFDPQWRFPVPVTTLACYGVWLSEQGYKPGTINAQLAGIGWWHKLKGFSDPSSSFLIKRLRVGLAKKGPPVRQAAPVRFALLEQILGILPSLCSVFDLCLFRAVFLLAYFASLRISEYAHTGSSNHTLLLKDVGFFKENGEEGLVLIFSSYKASQKPAKLFVPQGPNISCCPVQALRDYLLVRPAGSGPPFSSEVC